VAQTVYLRTQPESRRVYLPWEKELSEIDKSWFEHKKMTEGDYQGYIDLTSKVKLASKSKTKGKEDEKAEMDMLLGTTRMYLIKTVVVGWNLVDDKGQNIPPTENNIRRLPPEVVKVWIDDIYDFNPVLKVEEDDDGDTVLVEETGEIVPKEI
jgi:hypothetical protein